MLSKSLLTAMLGAAGIVSAADPSLPVASPDLKTLYNKMATDMLANMPGVASKWTTWNNGSTVKGCQTYIDKYGLARADFTVYSVTYDDCGSHPWVFCLHKNAPFTITDMANRFGRIPPSTRGYVNVFVGLAKQSDGYAGWSTTNGDIALMGAVDMRILAHEFSHHLDYDAYYTANGKKYTSNTATWQDEYFKDKYAPSAYSKNSWQESIAEIGSAAFYDVYVPGGIAKIDSATSGFQNQLTAFENIFAAQMVKGGTCSFRKAWSPVVSSVNSAKFGAAAVEEEDKAFEMIPEPSE